MDSGSGGREDSPGMDVPITEEPESVDFLLPQIPDDGRPCATLKLYCSVVPTCHHLGISTHFEPPTDDGNNRKNKRPCDLLIP